MDRVRGRKCNLVRLFPILVNAEGAMSRVGRTLEPSRAEKSDTDPLKNPPPNLAR